MQLASAALAALLVGGLAAALAAQSAHAQAAPAPGPLCQALDAWVHDPVGAVNETLIEIGHNQADEGTSWVREHAQRVVDNTVYDYVRSRAEKDLNLADAENELTDSIRAVVQGPADEQTAARQRLGRVLSIDLPAFLARAVPACANADTPVGGS
ncbi:MAG TPA: hypothetical protein VFE37_08695 [Chloroflexota bacterium]|nr:hypothetical protein [Chloroflexota bacterium]